MWIVLAHEQDVPAQWAAEGLKNLGLKPLVWLEAEALAQADIWSHRLGRNGVSIEIRLRDGSTIRSSEIKGVLNRLLQVPAGHMRSIRESDQLYTFQEMAAFYLSWLNGLNCPVVNLPQPNGMAGPMMQPSIWYALAARAGLNTCPLSLNSGQPLHEIWGLPNNATSARQGDRSIQIFVVGDHVVETRPVAEVPAYIRHRCIELARMAGARLLGLHLLRDTRKGWLFAQADVLPDLREGGSALLEALAVSLSSELSESRISEGWRSAKAEMSERAISEFSDKAISRAADGLISEVEDGLISEVGGKLISEVDEALSSEVIRDGARPNTRYPERRPGGTPR